MSAATPGQAAYEAFHASIGLPVTPEYCGDWPGMDNFEQAHWETAAAAAIEAGPAAPERLAKGNTKLREERDRYSEALKRIVDTEPPDAVDKLARNALGWTRVPRPKKPQPASEVADELLRNIDALHGLIRDILQSMPDTADEQEWRDRAGTLHVCDPDGQPYRAYTEDDL